MAAAINDPPFLDFGNAAELYASGLHEVEVHGSVVRFVMYVERHHNGENVRIPVFTCTVPLDAVAPAIGLTIRRLGPSVLLPEVARRFLMGDGDGKMN